MNMNENFAGVYIMGNENKTLYTGMSNNVIRRVLEHKKGKKDGFTKKYNLKKCLYYEFSETGNMRAVIIREKQIKNLSRKEKLALIEEQNPLFLDISTELFSLVDDVSDVVTFD